MSRTRIPLLAAMALVAAATGTAFAVVPGDVSTATIPCTVDYKVQNQWDTGFIAAVTVTNNGAAKSSWAVTWSYTGNQNVTNAWNAEVTQSGASVTAANETYNGALGTGSSISFGFQGTYSGSKGFPSASPSTA